MTELHFPFLESAILIPLAGALWVRRIRDPYEARKWCVLFAGFTCLATIAAWQDFALVHSEHAHDRWDLSAALFGRPLFELDDFNAPLLPMVALLYFLTTVATLRTKIRRFSFALSLVSESIRLATFSCSIPWGIILLLALGTLPPLLELRARNRPTRVYFLHMAAFIACLIAGWAMIDAPGGAPDLVHHWAPVLLLLAVLIRSGIAPFHCWMTHLFEHATFGTALLFVTPLTCAYAAIRLVLPVAPDWMLRSIGLLSLLTAVYAAGMALVQKDARRFFCYVFISHSAVVLIGLEVASPIGLTGALCSWLSTSLSLVGFGLTLRALESRFGRLSLTSYCGLYDQTPTLAACFALTGLASVGFPGTLGFVGTEMLVDGAIVAYPYIGFLVVLASALTGIAVVRAYFLIFTGARHYSTVSLQVGMRERFAVLLLFLLLLGGGIMPHPGVASRYHAAELILRDRRERLGLPPDPHVPSAEKPAAREAIPSRETQPVAADASLIHGRHN